MAKTGTYRGTNMTALQGLAEGGGGGDFKRATWFKLEEFDKEYTIRILPGLEEDDNVPFIKHYFHACNLAGRNQGWQVLDEEGEPMTRQDGSPITKMLTSLREHDVEDEFGKCPMGELLDWAEEEGDDHLTTAFKVQSKTTCNMVDREMNEVQPWTPSASLTKRIIGVSQGKAGDIFHPKTGRDLVFVKYQIPKTSPRTQDWQRIRYKDPVVKDKSPIGIEWEEATPLKTWVNFRTRAEMLAVMQHNIGGMVPLSDIFPGEVEPRKRKAKKRSKK